MTFRTRGRHSSMASTLLAAITLAVTAACSTDGRELAAPLPHQSQTIVDQTAPPPVFDVDTLPSGETDALAPSGETDTLAPSGETDTLAPSGAFTVSAPWTDGGPIPVDHTCSGDGVSPSLVWTGAPIETQSFALVVTDRDALGPTGDPLVHWVVANIDPFVTSVGTGAATPGAIEGLNDLGRPDVPIVGWSPPCPPLGETHTYAFTLHALSQRLDLLDGTPAADLVRAIELSSLSSSTVTGTVLS